MSTADKIERLRALREEARQGGGARRLEQQHARGKLSARERLDLLLDEDTFTELDAFVTHRASEFGLEDERYLGDGVVTGSGKVTGGSSSSTARTSPFLAAHCPRRMPKRSAR